MKSYNRKLVCEPYVTAGGIQSEVKKGMTFIKQKSAVVGLKVLMDAQIDDKISIAKGSIVYLTEELLSTQPSYQKPLTSDAIKDPFVVVDFGHVLFVGE
jgi:hypothetical protein